MLQERAAQPLEVVVPPNEKQKAMIWCRCAERWLKRDPKLKWRKTDVEGITEDFNLAFPPKGTQCGNQPVKGACECDRPAPERPRRPQEIKRRRMTLTKISQPANEVVWMEDEATYHKWPRTTAELASAEAAAASASAAPSGAAPAPTATPAPAPTPGVRAAASCSAASASAASSAAYSSVAYSPAATRVNATTSAAPAPAAAPGVAAATSCSAASASAAPSAETAAASASAATGVNASTSAVPASAVPASGTAPATAPATPPTFVSASLSRAHVELASSDDLQNFKDELEQQAEDFRGELKELKTYISTK